jgi:iron complex transport system substrate-binding protein
MKQFLITILFMYGFIVCAETIIDESGNKIIFAKPFKRIISLYPAHTENIINLGCKSYIIGTSRSRSKITQSLNVKRFSSSDGAERFLALKPDLILVRPMLLRAHKTLFKQLRLMGVTVVSLQPTSINGMYHYWEIIGALIGKRSEAKAMVKKFKRDIIKLKKRVAHIPPNKRKRVYFESIHKRMKTFSTHSMAIFVLETAGGINIASDAIVVRKSNIAAYGKEKILSKANQIDIFLSQKGRMNPVTLEMIKGESGFEVIKAIKENKIFLIPESIVSRPTVSLLKGIKMIQKKLYF